MHREPLNQELANAFNLMIVPVVMAIVLFLAFHPLNTASSPSIWVGNMLACLFCP
jgi:hypothetical protein